MFKIFYVDAELFSLVGSVELGHFVSEAIKIN
jgi:hypothetical protein